MPTSIMNKELIIKKDWCKGCGICANVCPKKCIKMEEEAKFIK